MMRSLFRWSLVAVLGVLVLALLVGSDPAWLNLLWTLALAGLVVSGIGLVVGRLRRT